MSPRAQNPHRPIRIVLHIAVPLRHATGSRFASFKGRPVSRRAPNPHRLMRTKHCVLAPGHGEVPRRVFGGDGLARAHAGGGHGPAAGQRGNGPPAPAALRGGEIPVEFQGPLLKSLLNCKDPIENRAGKRFALLAGGGGGRGAAAHGAGTLAVLPAAVRLRLPPTMSSSHPPRC